MIEYIPGGISKDERGQIRFVNDFDMDLIKRFYIIKNQNPTVIRGWRGHRLEQRWFYVFSGSFNIFLVKIDDWETPSRDLKVDKIIFKQSDFSVLNVPKGYATAFQSNESDSELLVFADSKISETENDDHTWPNDYFININNSNTKS